MTTAHRPTWYNAIGGENQGGNRKVSQTAKVCSRDLPGHTKMKTRDLSEYIFDKEVIKNNLIQLENNNTSSNSSSNNNNKLLAIENLKKLTKHNYENLFPEDEDDDIEDDWKSHNKIKSKKKKRKKNINTNKTNSNKNKNEQNKSGFHSANDNKDDVSEPESDDDNSDSDDMSESDEDISESDEEEKELMRELEILKREKLEKQKKEKEAQELMKNKKNNVLTNNPLINLEDSSEDELKQAQKKRKWTEETIFRNTCEKKEKKNHFINDTVRTAFHQKFLFKYIH
ncbi:pre-mRNA-splicing factor CWC15, putative [Hepatocystis sp. ex Piliocolobus tephrosceles]|nr:pre-mRNA-splicing factor CWC15, putative [Hepatocystis sp. ex Piliocolobus tephrosceles]